MKDLGRRVRLAAFEFIGGLRMQLGDVTPRDPVIQYFQFERRRVSLISAQQGIFRSSIHDLALSLTTLAVMPGNGGQLSDWESSTPTMSREEESRRRVHYAQPV